MSGGIGSRGAIGEPEAADSGRARWLRLSRFRQYWREKLTTFGSKVHAPLREGNRVALYEDGGNVLEACRTLITEARRSIDVEMYIWAEDETGIEIAELLGAAVARGVNVRVLYDAVGSWEGTYHLQELRARGAEVVAFHPVGPFAFRGNPNSRNHRKLLIADDTVAVVGSQNFANEYDTLRIPGGFRDVGVGLSGPVVEDLARDFRRVFRRETGKALPPPHAPRTGFEPPAMLGEPASVQMVSGVKRGERGAMRALYLTILRQAVTEIVLLNAYFVPSLKLIGAFVRAARRGVRVVLVLPGESDVVLAQAAMRFTYGPLLAAGVEIWERQHRVLHAKAVVVDRAIAVVGSANLDARSFVHNLELNVNVHDSELSARLLASMEKDIEQSVRIDRASHVARPLAERVLSFLAYLLRYWL